MLVDPSRTHALLWRSLAQRRRGRKPRLTVDQIVGAAIRVADRDGLASMSMVRVAAELGTSTTSLYTYVPGKAQLIELMVDAVLLERRLFDVWAKDWRPRIEVFAVRTLDMHLRHPWLRHASPGLPPLGPGVLSQQEYLLGTLYGIGLPPAQVMTAVAAIVMCVDTAIVSPRQATGLRLQRLLDGIERRCSFTIPYRDRYAGAYLA